MNPETITPDRTRTDHRPVRTVRLADGAQWGLACPGTLLVPDVTIGTGEDGMPAVAVRTRARRGHSPAIARLVEGLVDALQGKSGHGPSDAFFSLAAALLRKAHDVDQSTAYRLLEVSGADLLQLVATVHEAVGGLSRGNPLVSEVP